MSQPYNPVAAEVEAIRRAYDASGPDYKLRTLLLNVVDNAAQRVQPPHVDQLRWQQALREAGGPDNADRCAAAGWGLGLAALGGCWGRRAAAGAGRGPVRVPAAVQAAVEGAGAAGATSLHALAAHPAPDRPRLDRCRPATRAAQAVAGAGQRLLRPGGALQGAGRGGGGGRGAAGGGAEAGAQAAGCGWSRLVQQARHGTRQQPAGQRAAGPAARDHHTAPRHSSPHTHPTLNSPPAAPHTHPPQVYNLQRKHELEIRGRIRAVQERHAEQQHQLLRCWRYIDALEHRFAAHSHRCAPAAVAARAGACRIRRRHPSRLPAAQAWRGPPSGAVAHRQPRHWCSIPNNPRTRPTRPPSQPCTLVQPAPTSPPLRAPASPTSTTTTNTTATPTTTTATPPPARRLEGGSEKEQQLARRVSGLEAELLGSSASSFRHRAEALASAVRLRRASITAGHSALAGAKFDQASMEGLFSVLQGQVAAVKQLQEVLRADLLEVEVMRGEVEGSDEGPLNMTMVRAA
jgi:hypothetical protein